MWLSYTIKTIWQHIHQIWKHRCNVNHGTTPNDKRQRALLRLTPKIASLYEKQSKIDPIDNNIFEKTQEELLQLPIHIIERWLHKAQIKTTDSIKRQQLKTQRTHQPIRNFSYRVIPAHQQLPQPPINNQPPNPAIRRNFITTTLGNFFRVLNPRNNDPYIPLPRNDDRPP
jgi:hypothetical protein